MNFDFENLGPLRLADAVQGEDITVELRPVYDPALRIFSVQLWKDDSPSGIHGLTDQFRYADEPLEAIDAFLAENDVRALTGDEAVLLYAGLVRAKGGPDWQIFQMKVAAAEQG
ncbi:MULTISPECIES: hypothetical protein [Streptomyces]|uniref:hypothetical protein n=1 Tax=Streptomyces TaxID=1883 RepID=UPI00073DFC7B|nr:hypothetical protein [Streptomyces sp. FBKL.4005]OYP10248.1 hypothetical protein CFC35_41385 [Streptomyces sp. FBKL.4005]CUW33432.1 hypothetical protein TUE45_pSRTUE45a_0064 [Streptomyces reticuli]